MITNNVLVISDVDGTLVNTQGAVRDAQLRTFERLGHSYEQAQQYLNELGLKNSVETYLGMDLNTFFDKHYKTFDALEAAQAGKIDLFEDTKPFLENFGVVAISNSEQEATEKKLAVLGIDDMVLGIHAEYLQETAKPNLYLAEKALKELDDRGKYSSSMTLIHVGDQEYDVQFGHNIKHIHPNTISLRIDRGKNYKGVNPDGVVTSLAQVGDYYG